MRTKPLWPPTCAQWVTPSILFYAAFRSFVPIWQSSKTTWGCFTSPAFFGLSAGIFPSQTFQVLLKLEESDVKDIKALSCPGCACSSGGIRCHADPGAQKWVFISMGNFSGTGGAQHAAPVVTQRDTCLNIPFLNLQPNCCEKEDAEEVWGGEHAVLAVAGGRSLS